MPSLPAITSLYKRAVCYNNGYGYNSGYSYNCNSRWNDWGRWVLFGALVGLAILFFLVFSCITARRRRRAGRVPIMGTGWAAPSNSGQQFQQPPTQQAYYNSGPPAYQPQPNGAANDYYGGQSYGVQQPQQAYGAGFNRDVNSTVYDPPKDAPPPPNRL